MRQRDHAALNIYGLSAGYDNVKAIRNVSLSVGSGEVVGLLGANGAGKSTTLLAAAGAIDIFGGEIELFGESIIGLNIHSISRLGLKLVPEDRGIFRQLSVIDNIRLNRPRSKNYDSGEVFEWFPALEPLAEQQAGLLSGGEQQMLALGCKLHCGPRVLMIDEMSLGLAPRIVAELLPVVRGLARDRGCAVLLVEQHVEGLLSVADRAYVLRQGEIAFEGPALELAGDLDRIMAEYLSVEPGS